MEKGGHTLADKHFTPLVNIAREPVATSADDYTTALYFTTDQYTYFVHVDKQDLILKKFKTGDTGPSANPRNNKQFCDKFYPSCASCTPDDGMASEPGKTVVASKQDSLKAGSPTDSADGSSGPRSSSSQLSSPEGSSTSPVPQKHATSSGSLDSGVEAN